MDDQNNPGGTAPSEPTTPGMPSTPPATEPAPEPTAQKCVTCGESAANGVCTACGQGEITCSCQPVSGGQGGPVQGGPTSPVGEQSPSAPAV